jgi:hypothetical protein
MLQRSNAVLKYKLKNRLWSLGGGVGNPDCLLPNVFRNTVITARPVSLEQNLGKVYWGASAGNGGTSD